MNVYRAGMPATFRRRPSHRKERSPQARWLVLGNQTPRVVHDQQHALLIPFKSGDHHRRYSPGQRLQVKTYVPGPTEAHVILTGVQGPRELFHLSDVDYPIAKDLGHHRLDDFHLDWVLRNDDAWIDRTDPDTDDMLARFQSRWAGKLAWLLRFQLDRTAPPRLLAARSDELYVENEAQALQGEMPALYEDQHKRHVQSWAENRRVDRLAEKRAERRALPRNDRLNEARASARSKGLDVRREFERYQYLARKQRWAEADRQLGYIEALVFPAAA